MVKKKVSSKNPSPKASWPKAIKELRDRLGLGQRGLAEAVAATQAMVWGWESGRSEPNSAIYIKLGNLAAESGLAQEALAFWQRAGLSPDSVLILAPALKKLLHERVAAKQKLVPILRDFAYIHSPGLAPAPAVEDWIPLPLSWLQHPDSTSCVRVPHAQVRSLFNEGDLLLVDASDQSFESLWGQIVAVEHKGGDLPSGRDLGPHLGVHVGLLRKHDLGEHGFIAELDSSRLNFIPKGLVDVAEHLGTDKHIFGDSTVRIATKLNTPAYAESEPWDILGRVVGWIASPESRKREDVSPRASVRPGRSRDRD